jgi:hypothetical protein
VTLWRVAGLTLSNMIANGNNVANVAEYLAGDLPTFVSGRHLLFIRWSVSLTILGIPAFNLC